MMDFLLVFLLIVANGIFAMSEIAVVSARETRLAPLARRGNKAAQAALALMDSPNDFLSTVQIGITLIGILAGAVSGATLAEKLAPILARIEWLAPYSETVSLTLMVALVTYLSLVIGELVPKRLALNAPEEIAMQMARPMRLLSVLARPIVRLLSISTEIVTRLLGMMPSTEPPVTEEEMKALLKQGTEAGVFEQAEHRVVRRALELDDLSVTSLMTPRPDIIWLALDDSVEEIRTKLVESNLSRLPVADGDLDRVVGIARTTELLVACTESESINLRDHLYEPVFIPASTSPAQALELFRESRLHTILVIDEYGGVIGLITPTDILEFIVGQLPSGELADGEEQAIVQREDGSWLIDGMVPLHDIASVLPEDNPFHLLTTRIQTINGFIMQQLERIPTTGEVFAWSGYRFEVVDMDGNRVDKVLISPIVEENTR